MSESSFRVTRPGLLHFMEVDVLTEAVKTMEQLRPVFFVENTTLERSRQLLEMLLSLNY